ncbi:MAG: hypothetical protein F9K29_11610 [Hyphomicrobiaceae bacterium]|nr:MAG: hypothetical protein F9K29_11610 [Hyphomicrobiaceae bacterium]
MRKHWKTLAVASAVAASALAATALYADTRHQGRDSMMGRGMMGMMGQQSGMMDHCAQMMGAGTAKPNEQWKKEAPKAPEKKE